MGSFVGEISPNQGSLHRSWCKEPDTAHPTCSPRGAYLCLLMCGFWCLFVSPSLLCGPFAFKQKLPMSKSGIWCVLSNTQTWENKTALDNRTTAAWTLTTVMKVLSIPAKWRICYQLVSSSLCLPFSTNFLPKHCLEWWEFSTLECWALDFLILCMHLRGIGGSVNISPCGIHLEEICVYVQRPSHLEEKLAAPCLSLELENESLISCIQISHAKLFYF